MRRSEGFTLIELLISIVVASIVLFAGATIILLGVNTNKIVSDSATMQNDSRVITQLMHNLTSRGTIDRVETSGNTTTLYELVEAEDEETPASQRPVLVYDGDQKVIRGADSGSFPLVSNVDKFEAALLADGRILNLELTVDGVSYSRNVYCRTRSFEEAENEGIVTYTEKEQTEEKVEEEKAQLVADLLQELMDSLQTDESSVPDNKEQREAFLQLLGTQFGSNGEVVGGSGSYAGWYNPAWEDNEDVAWCACFVSWAANIAAGSEVGLLDDAPVYAWVPDLLNYFQDTSNESIWHGTDFTPSPGDYVFFDFNPDTDEEGNPIADHVGVVLAVQNDTVFTIEGNSGGRVAIRAYPINFDNILGYGVLDWAS